MPTELDLEDYTIYCETCAEFTTIIQPVVCTHPTKQLVHLPKWQLMQNVPIREYTMRCKDSYDIDRAEKQFRVDQISFEAYAYGNDVFTFATTASLLQIRQALSKVDNSDTMLNSLTYSVLYQGPRPILSKTGYYSLEWGSNILPEEF